MARSHISKLKRQIVSDRANNKCEYCLLAEEDSAFSFHIDHIRPEIHGGSNELDNLALACPACNLHKGTNIATYLGESDEITRLFNPRKDLWEKHFKLDRSTGKIAGNSAVGKATTFYR